MDYSSLLDSESPLVGIPSNCSLCSRAFDFDYARASSIDACANCKFLLFDDLESRVRNSPIVSPMAIGSEVLGRRNSRYLDPLGSMFHCPGTSDGDVSPILFRRPGSHVSPAGSRQWIRFTSDTESEEFGNFDIVLSDCEPSISSLRHRYLPGDADAFSVSTIGADDFSVDERCTFDTEMSVPLFYDDTSSYSDADIDPMHAGRRRWDQDVLDEEGPIEWMRRGLDEQVVSRVIDEIDDDVDWEEPDLEERVLVDRSNQVFPGEDDIERSVQPASTSYVNSLPRFILSKILDKEHELGCAICKDSLDADSEALQLPCKHLYHPACILPWLRYRNNCPMCRSELPVDEKDDAEERMENRTVRILDRYTLDGISASSDSGNVTEGDRSVNVESSAVASSHSSDPDNQTNRTRWVVVGAPIVGFLLALWLRRYPTEVSTNVSPSNTLERHQNNIWRSQTFSPNQRPDSRWRWWFS